MIKPILFNTEMVRAILDGRKTVTRRVVKPQPTHEQPDSLKGSSMWWGSKMFLPPYQAGDVMWVRETWKILDVLENASARFEYLAGGEISNVISISAKRLKTVLKFLKKNGWLPSLFMPREAARIFLKVKNVRAERLQEMTVEDIEREGLYCDAPYTKDHYAYAPGMMLHWQRLWNSTVKPTDLDHYGWDANPWVWVISFERTDKPEDFA